MLKNILVITSLLLLVAGLTGCVPPASEPENMAYTIPSSVKLQNPQFKNAINVEKVSGGSETNSNVSNDAVKEALTSSLKNAGLFSNSNTAKYTVDAQLVNLDQPTAGGINLHVSCQIHYQVKNISNSSIIYDKTISSDYTATLSDSVIFMTRIRMATEGAMKANIQKFINGIYRIK